jgi:aminoglycoside phosphotransferase (APT) family kinase protein
MNADVRTAVEAAFPDRVVASADVVGPSWNEANETAKVTFEDGGVAYLKRAVDGNADRLESARAATAYVDAESGVAAPTVLAGDFDREVPYLATAPLEGKPLWVLLREADRERQAALLERVGRTLAALHADRFDAHGRVVGGGAEGLDLRTGAWTDVLAATVEEMRELAPSDRYASHFEAVREAIEAERGRLDGAPAALLHGDPAAPNFLVTDDRVGCVDWERAHVGDPARDLYRARDQLIEPTRGSGDGRLVEALHAGYRERAGGLPAGLEDRRPVYRLVRLLGVSGFFERHVETREESAAELADWLEAEFDRRLAAV